MVARAAVALLGLRRRVPLSQSLPFVLGHPSEEERVLEDGICARLWPDREAEHILFCHFEAGHDPDFTWLPCRSRYRLPHVCKQAVALQALDVSMDCELLLVRVGRHDPPLKPELALTQRAQALQMEHWCALHEVCLHVRRAVVATVPWRDGRPGRRVLPVADDGNPPRCARRDLLEPEVGRGDSDLELPVPVPDRVAPFG